MQKENIEGVEIAYEESGSPAGNPVVIMHGWGCNHSTVRFVRDCIPNSYRIINIDLPGHGESSEPLKAWNTEDFALAVQGLFERINIKNPILIGHSFGGRISIKIASQGKVDKMVLIDSAGIKPKRRLNYYLKVYSFKATKKLIYAFHRKERAEQLIERMRQKKGSSDYAMSTPVMRHTMSICVNEDLKHLLPSITAPTLLIWGEKDTATPLSDAKIMEKLIPDAGIVSFADAGHYSFLDNPHGFKAVLSNFLKN